MVKLHYGGVCIAFTVALELILFASATFCEYEPPFRSPPLPSLEQTTYEIKEGEKVYISTRTIARETHNGQPVYRLLTHNFEIVVKADDLRTVEVKKLDGTGKVEYTAEYSDTHRRVRFIYPRLTKNRVKDLPKYSYDVNTMLEVLRGFPFDKNKPKVKFTLVTPEHVVGVYAKIKATEKISTALGAFDCYLIEAGVSGLKGKVFKTKYLFWIEKVPPYRVIRHKDSNDERIITLIGYERIPQVEEKGN